MKILLYTSERSGRPEGLSRLVEMPPRVAQFETLCHHGELMTRLRGFRGNIDVLVLQPADQAELRDFVALKNLFVGLRVVVALPDASAETISLGHRLHPRYAIQPDAPNGWLRAILNTMIQNVANDMDTTLRAPDASKAGDAIKTIEETN